MYPSDEKKRKNKKINFQYLNHGMSWECECCNEHSKFPKNKNAPSGFQKELSVLGKKLSGLPKNRPVWRYGIVHQKMKNNMFFAKK
jgi:hypothetical protein